MINLNLQVSKGTECKSPLRVAQKKFSGVSDSYSETNNVHLQ
jgi:hypothetical protein